MTTKDCLFSNESDVSFDRSCSSNGIVRSAISFIRLEGVTRIVVTIDVEATETVSECKNCHVSGKLKHSLGCIFFTLNMIEESIFSDIERASVIDFGIATESQVVDKSVHNIDNIIDAILLTARDRKGAKLGQVIHHANCFLGDDVLIALDHVSGVNIAV